MIVHNFNELASEFSTSPKHISTVLSNLAHMDLAVENSPVSVRISHFISECNADMSCTFRYPFDSRAVVAFAESLESMIAAMYDIYDDPFDMMMEMTNPSDSWTIEDAGQCLSEAEANGWKFAPHVTPQFILDLYNDMNPEEEKGDSQ